MLTEEGDSICPDSVIFFWTPAVGGLIVCECMYVCLCVSVCPWTCRRIARCTINV